MDDEDYQVPFTFTGKLNKLTIKIDRPQLSPADIQKLKEASATTRPLSSGTSRGEQSPAAAAGGSRCTSGAARNQLGSPPLLLRRTLVGIGTI